MRNFVMLPATGGGNWSDHLRREGNLEGQTAQQAFMQEIAIVTARGIMKEMGLVQTIPEEMEDRADNHLPPYERREIDVYNATEIGAISNDRYELPPGSICFKEVRLYSVEAKSMLGRLMLKKPVESLVGGNIYIEHSEWPVTSARIPVVSTVHALSSGYVNRFLVCLEQIAKEKNYPLPQFSPLAHSYDR